MMLRYLVASGMLLAAAQAVSAQGTTVQSFLQQGYTIVGVFPSSAGPGLFLQKGDSLFVCFVAEEQGSPTAATQYCKPVK